MCQLFFRKENDKPSESLDFCPNLLLLNINTINPDKTNVLVSELDIFDSIEFLCIVEIGIKEEFVHNVHIERFKLVSYYCRPNLKCGGVGLWAKQGVLCQSLELGSYCIEQHFEICGLSFNRHNKKYIIFNIYRSPCGDTKIFFSKLQEVIEAFFKPRVKFLICGDFNFDWGSLHFVSLCTFFTSYQLQPVIKFPTRVTENSSTIIDQIFISDSNDVYACVTDNIISDHRSIYLEFMTLNEKPMNQSFMKRQFTENNFINFETCLSNEHWQDLYEMNDLNEAFNLFYSTFLFYFNSIFPEQKFVQKCDRSKSWVNSEVRLSSRNLKDLFVLQKTFTELAPIYREKKKQHSQLLLRTQKQFYAHKIVSSDNSTKMAWKIINEMNNNKKGNENIVLTEEDKLITNPSEIAFKFNDFFIESPKSLVSRLNNCKKITVENSINQSGSMFLTPFVEAELHTILLNKMKNKTSSGADEIPNFVLKKVLPLIIKPLTFLVNLSFLLGKFPNDLKIGKVVPIFKKDNPKSIENYRAITIPSCFQKIFEYAFLDRLLHYLQKQTILNINQHGFQNNKSTTTAIHQFYSRVIHHLQDGECPAAIFCDLSRAFDCVNYHTLLCKLEGYGIRGTTLDWISSFLFGRKQFVSLQFSENQCHNVVKSECLTVDMGVPQGSILGPILFLLYVNNINSALTDTEHVAYADDFSLIVSASDDELLTKQSESILSITQSYFSGIDLYFNHKKTEVIKFHNWQNKCSNIVIPFEGTQLIGAESTKFLGLFIDKNLNWKTHCQSLIKKLSSSSYLFRHMRQILSKELLVTLYYAQIDSRLRYGVIFWGDSTLASEVFLCQKKVIRIIEGATQRSPCKPLFQKLKILTLTGIYLLEVSSLMFANKHDLRFNHNVHNIDTRSKDNIYIPLAKLRVSSKAPTHMGARVYNHLPDYIKKAETLSCFKSLLKKFLLGFSFYSVNEFFDTKF